MNHSLTYPAYSSSASNTKNYLILFLIWPFLAFIFALSNYQQKEAKRIVYFFLVYFGLTLVVQPGTDSFRYVEDFVTISTLPFSDFFDIVRGLYSTDTSIDIIDPFICFVVSRFTSHHGLLFGAYALLFGFFYLRSILLLYNLYRKNPGWNTMIFMIFFIGIIPITYINAPRMWIAAWMFFYGAYHVVLYRDKRFLLLTLFASLMHWSFITANVVLLIYYFVGNRNLLYFPLVFLSFIFPGILTPVFRSASLVLGGAIQNRYAGYTNESYNQHLQEATEQVNWFISLSKDLIFYYLLIALAVIHILHRHLMKEKTEKNLFSFSLLFLAFINFGQTIPSFGDRFQIVFMLFATLYVFFYMLKFQGNKITWLTLMGIFPMALYLAVVFRKGSDFFNAWIFLPGFGLPFFADDIPLAQLLFG